MFAEPRWIVPAFTVLLVFTGVLISPIAIPVLTVRSIWTTHRPLDWLRRNLNITAPALCHRSTRICLAGSQWRRKWRCITNSLPVEERARTGIFANDYGEAGAIDFFGPRYGLPPAISGHQNYWFWGPHGYTGESLIVLGDNEETLKSECASVTQIAILDDKYARRDELGPVFHCRGLKWNLIEMWPQMKKWN